MKGSKNLLKFISSECMQTEIAFIQNLFVYIVADKNNVQFSLCDHKIFL